jgi:hypothetical protein
MSISAIQKKVVEVMRIIILVFSFLILTNAVNAETLLHCKFKSGTTYLRKEQTNYTMDDVFLKIDFNKKKVIESPFGVYGTFGVSKTNILFTTSEVKWWGENDYVKISVSLNRQTGELISNRNSLKEFKLDEEKYLCSKGKLKF